MSPGPQTLEPPRAKPIVGDARLAEAIRIAQADPQTGYMALVSLVEAEPENPNALYALGDALHKARRWQAAAIAFKRARALGRTEGYTLVNIGWNLHLSGRSEEALEVFEAALRLNPADGLAHSNMAQVLVILGRADEAVQHARLGIEHGETSQPAHYMSLAFALFSQRRWAEGWRAYESRVRFKFPEFDRYPMPRWRGQPAERLFVQAEQGLGDTLMCWRWVLEASERVGRLIFFVQPELRTLLEHNKRHNIEIQAMPCTLPQADAFAPMMSLPVGLGLDDAGISRWPGEYIRVQEPLKAVHLEPGRAAWGEYETRERPWPPHRVALVWAGSAEHDNDRWRSAVVGDFAPLLELPDIDWVSLQVGPRAADASAAGLFGLLKDLSPRLRTMEDTARELARVDLLISVDTSCVHLAGAMGVPTWMLVANRAADWRWAQTVDGEPSIWYPSVKVRLQAVGETWLATATRLVKELET